MAFDSLLETNSVSVYEMETFDKNSKCPEIFKFTTACLLENCFPIFPIPSKIFRFPEEFCFLPKQTLLGLAPIAVLTCLLLSIGTVKTRE